MALYEHYGAELMSRHGQPPLYPTAPWRPQLSTFILEAKDTAMFETPLKPDMAQACRAGLLLFNDDLDAAHNIAQGIDNETGSFWHAIIHRREGDASNSAYWWGLTGEHPVFAEIFSHVVTMKQVDGEAAAFIDTLKKNGAWLPVEFVAACERVKDKRREHADLCQIQRLEMLELLTWCRADGAMR